jgi:hypothetical protein
MSSNVRASARNRTISYLMIRLCLWKRPAGRGAGADADLEVKRPGLLVESKFDATSYRSHRAFGPHGIDRYNLDPDTDQESVRRKQQCSC